ncbi:MAG: MotA/TolQ/ExbB proton channel family protein [Bacteroidales bacterium]|nr:MotA/TolQ/ExbB proton channel family protein [Bacteroidales bacterium]
MIIRHLYEGGFWFMLPILVMWVVVIVLALRFLLKHHHGAEKYALKRMNTTILFLGSLALLYGIMGQILGLFEALIYIQEMGGVSASALAAGLRVSMICTAYGFVLFMLTVIIWYLFRHYLIK